MLLDRVSNQNRTANITKPERTETANLAETRQLESQSNTRQTDLAFQSSITRFRILSKSAVSAQAQPTPVNNVRTDVVDAVVESFENTPTSSWQDRLLYVLREDEDLNLTHEEQLAVIG